MKARKVYVMWWNDLNHDEVIIREFDGYSFEQYDREWLVYSVKCTIGERRWYTYVLDPFSGVSIDLLITTADDELGAAEATVLNISLGYGNRKFNRFYQMIEENPEAYAKAREMYQKALEMRGIA